MVSYLGQLGPSKRGTSWVGQAGSSSNCIAGSVFEVDA